MARTIAGIILASIALYLWGFLYWGAGPYRTRIWKQPLDENAARVALREHFPENGTYYVPGFAQDQEAIDRSFRAGPVALVHMLAVDGRPMVEPSIMIKGFFLNLAVIILITIFLWQTALAFPRYADRVKLIVIVALTAAVGIDGAEVFWWQIPWTWKLYQGVYDFSFWLIAGAIMARFVK